MHEVLKRRVVRQVNSGLNALSPKHGNRRRIGHALLGHPRSGPELLRRGTGVIRDEENKMLF